MKRRRRNAEGEVTRWLVTTRKRRICCECSTSIGVGERAWRLFGAAWRGDPVGVLWMHGERCPAAVREMLGGEL